MNTLSSTTFSSDCFAARYGAPLPRDLRDQAANMSWAAFLQRFGARTGPIRLGSWSAQPGPGGQTRFDATFGVGNAIHTTAATSHGPIDALTSMLYDAGFHIEILNFHQQSISENGTHAAKIATFVLCEFDGRRAWSMAMDGDGTSSSIRAVIGAANMLHG
ncbi:2-isopropylmalate synthase [Rhodococcus sp. PAMC28707]|uniref:alpha-isopropylmalate synthase regulatory domain-containing protein n=1 Tax=unclassified Rhodococcus (in: high G+C Gram-positive bacteria) TaxID=192944 RepID=UPI00109E20C3|nr:MULTISPECIES: alpha-isopropylmalate synthase regulatory domain-containing protein [unclassified Rhodococcus (in: high G+C Gram-positive bacteria)]QCB49352.1 2-isopropylmalate synthase [Rhodococcus sp. PAMC28705]QCB58960.1 2-isopropylmalate synthase [Rhodococcus sp. PAMC28707]